MLEKEIILLAVGSLLAFVSNFIKEGVFVRLPHKRDARLIEVTDRIEYPTKNAKSNHRNVLALKESTGRYVPIHVVDQILRCYDPCLAVHIYSTAPSYLCLASQKKGRIPKHINRKVEISRVSWWILSLLCLFILFLSLFLMIPIANIAADRPERAIASLAVFSLLVTTPLLVLGFAGREIIFLNDVKRFYRGE